MLSYKSTQLIAEFLVFRGTCRPSYKKQDLYSLTEDITKMLQFTTVGILMALSGLAPSQSTPVMPVANTVPPIVEEVRPSSKKVYKISQLATQEDVEEYAREYFHDTPILAEVARCESTFRHFGKDGYVLRGLVDKRDVGLMQINEGYHLDTANKLGTDIYTIEGNMEYAKVLYQKFGLSPWKASSKCWLPKLELAYR